MAEEKEMKEEEIRKKIEKELEKNDLTIDEILEKTWEHAISYYGPITQGKFFLVFSDGEFSDPLDGSNVVNEGWDGYVAKCDYINPYDACDFDAFLSGQGITQEEYEELEEKDNAKWEELNETFVDEAASSNSPYNFDLDWNEEID